MAVRQMDFPGLVELNSPRMCKAALFLSRLVIIAILLSCGEVVDCFLP